METRVGVVAIVLDDINFSPMVNDILHDHAGIIVGRMGIPYKEKGVSVCRRWSHFFGNSRRVFFVFPCTHARICMVKSNSRY